MDEERTEEARAAGFLHLVLGGTRVELPVLKIRQARAWKEKLGATEMSPTDLESDMDYPMRVMLDLVAAYDVTGVLGGVEAIEDRATDREVYAAFRAMLEATYPFVDTATMVGDFARLVVAAFYRRANTTSGPSRIGASTRTGSKRATPKSSSSSSGKLASVV